MGAAAGLLEDEGARKIWLEVDGAKRQDSVLGEMVWSVPEMIARLSEVRDDPRVWCAAVSLPENARVPLDISVRSNAVVGVPSLVAAKIRCCWLFCDVRGMLDTMVVKLFLGLIPRRAAPLFRS